MLPAFLRAGRDAHGLDRAAGVSLRVTGVAALALLALAAVFLVAGLISLVGIWQRGDRGWDGLVAGVTLGLGTLSLGAGIGLLSAAHIGFGAWATQRRVPVRNVGIALSLVGATFWMPRAWQMHAAPLDDYLALARFVVLVLGILILVGSRRLPAS